MKLYRYKSLSTMVLFGYYTNLYTRYKWLSYWGDLVLSERYILENNT